jgi:hypothetical protein
MAGGKEKICTSDDHSQLFKSGSSSCAICCASSDDPAELCDPVEKFGDNLFCDPKT